MDLLIVLKVDQNCIYIHTVHDRKFGELPAKNIVYVWFWPALHVTLVHPIHLAASPPPHTLLTRTHC